MSREVVVFLSPIPWDSSDEAWRRLPTRCAREHDVVVLEQPIFDATEPELELRRDGVIVAVPHFDLDTPADVAAVAQRLMLARILDELRCPHPVLWYRTPGALAFTHHLDPSAIVYDPGQSWPGGSSSVPSSVRDQLLRQHADVVLADPTRELAWHDAWPLVDRAISARLAAGTGRFPTVAA